MPRFLLLGLVANAFLLPAACSTQEPTQPATSTTAATDLAPGIERALTWLVAHQDEDGRFDVGAFMKHDREGAKCDGAGYAVHDLGATSLVVLAMLGDGSTMRAGPYKKPLTRSVQWLRAQQQDDGRFGTATSPEFVHDHAIATYAMCEAYGLSGYPPLKPFAQKGIDYLQAHRSPRAGWRHQGRDSDALATAWALLALTSGKRFGLDVDEEAWRSVAVWFDQITDENGRVGYSEGGGSNVRSVEARGTESAFTRGEAQIAAVLAGRFLIGQTPETQPSMQRSASRLAEHPPEWKSDRVDACAWYLGAFAMRKTGGESWASWQPGLAQIAGAQRRDASFAGSWDPVGVWSVEGGRVVATALCAMTLQVACRYAREGR